VNLAAVRLAARPFEGGSKVGGKIADLSSNQIATNVARRLMNSDGAASGALGVISAMVTPALMILAAASLASSALLRMGRIVDRARLLASMVHEGRLDQFSASPEVVARWLESYRKRARRTALSVFSLYAAIVMFVAGCLTIGVQHVGADLPDFAALALILPGAVLLLLGAVGIAAETGALVAMR
jgi:hypothetical protein